MDHNTSSVEGTRPLTDRYDVRSLDRSVEEAVETGDLAGRRLREALRAFADCFDDPPVRDDELVVVESVGSAVLDAATADWLLERARDADAGVDVPL